MAETDSLRNRLAEVLMSLQRHKKTFPAAPDMPPGEFFTLRLIELHRDENSGGMTVAQLREMSRTSGPAMSQMLRTLEKKGLVTRVTDQQDRRKVLVSVTEQGQLLLEKCKAVFLDAVERVCREFGKQETERLIAMLVRFRAVFYDEMACARPMCEELKEE